MNELKREARIVALKTLYEQEFHYQSIKESDIKKDIHKPDRKEPEIEKYSSEICQGIKEKKQDIDVLIQQTSKSWSLERMSLIDLNIMRIAIYEMIYSAPTVPFKVCINEALEIAKIYGTTDSSSFINGILDTVSHNIQEHPPIFQKRKASINEGKKVKVLHPHQALKAGADLWVLSDSTCSKQWNARVDWYTNFLITKNNQQAWPSLNAKRKELLKKYGVPEVQKTVNISQRKTSPLLIKSSQYLPNLLTLILKHEPRWLDTTYQMWCSLKKPRLRIFAPHLITAEDVEKVWKDEMQDLQYMKDS